MKTYRVTTTAMQRSNAEAEMDETDVNAFNEVHAAYLAGTLDQDEAWVVVEVEVDEIPEESTP